MPTDVQISLQGISNLPEDRFVNTLYFDGDQWDASLTDELWSKYLTLINFCISGVNQHKHRISCYTPGPNPGGPYFTKEYSIAGNKANAGPTEVAICLSYATVEDPEASTPRRRGRIYLGPLDSAFTNAPRPSIGLRDAALDLGEGIAQVGLASNVTWMMRSRADASYHKIESIWTDDAWDSQRRRGLKPTLRETRNVQ